MYYQCDLRTVDLSLLRCKFDVVLMNPPWDEYFTRDVSFGRSALVCSNSRSDQWTLQQIAALRIDHLVQPSGTFLCIWMPKGDLLDASAALLKHWGFRKIEVITWIKSDGGPTEHCVIGLNNTQLKRSVDGKFIHSNCDCDTVITQSASAKAPMEKPVEVFEIIERFCAGRKRIELFADMNSLRDGWLSVGRNVPEFPRFDAHSFLKLISAQPATNVVLAEHSNNSLIGCCIKE